MRSFVLLAFVALAFASAVKVEKEIEDQLLPIGKEIKAVAYKFVGKIRKNLVETPKKPKVSQGYVI